MIHDNFLGMPLGGIALELQNLGLISPKTQWRVIGAARTYNPLGNTVSFLNQTDISSIVEKLLL